MNEPSSQEAFHEMPAMTDLPPIPEAVTFEDGLVGLPDLRRFSVRLLEETPFYLVDSLDDETFGVIAANGDDVRPGYAAELAAGGLLALAERVLVIVSVHGDPPSMTANLAGPVLIDPATGAARQVVLEGDAYPLRATIWEAG